MKNGKGAMNKLEISAFQNLDLNFTSLPTRKDIGEGEGNCLDNKKPKIVEKIMLFPTKIFHNCPDRPLPCLSHNAQKLVGWLEFQKIFLCAKRSSYVNSRPSEG